MQWDEGDFDATSWYVHQMKPRGLATDGRPAAAAFVRLRNGKLVLAGHEHEYDDEEEEE
jgi:hypothetical protein